MTESRIQQSLFRWWTYAHIGLGAPDRDLLMAFPLQGQRSARNGARMKAEGMRRGTPDMLLAVACGGCHGLWIELKTPTGRVSPEQTAMLTRLQRQGYAAVVARGFDEAKKAVECYLGMAQRAPVVARANEEEFPHRD